MIVFFDIDGTLVDDRTQVIPQSTAQAIEALCRNGHIPAIATGRPFSHIDPRVKALPFRGFVCGCGMEVRYEDRWLLRNQPEESLCTYVRDSVRQCNMQVLYEQHEGPILTDGQWSSHPGCVRETRRMAQKGTPILEIDSLPAPHFMKFVTLDSPENCAREEFLRRMDPYFTCIIRDYTLVEYMKKGCSKGKGMEILQKELGLTREDTLAIGDSTNDLPMFEAAGHTVCMGDGMEETKARAEFVTDTVLGDGIRKALEHYHLI